MIECSHPLPHPDTFPGAEKTRFQPWLFDYVARGSDIAVLDSSGETPLFYAVGADCVLTVQACIESGLDINHLNVHGATPIASVCGGEVHP